MFSYHSQNRYQHALSPHNQPTSGCICVYIKKHSEVYIQILLLRAEKVEE